MYIGITAEVLVMQHKKLKKGSAFCSRSIFFMFVSTKKIKVMERNIYQPAFLEAAGIADK